MTLYTAERLAEMLGVQKSTVQRLCVPGEVWPHGQRGAQTPGDRGRPGRVHCAPHRPCAQRPGPRTANQLSPPAQ